MATLVLHLIVLLVVKFIIYSFTEGLVTTIDVTVEGTHVLKSGVQQYCVFGRYFEPFVIKCEVQTVVQPNTTEILKNGSALEENIETEETIFTKKWSTKVSEVTNEVIYTCRAIFYVNCVNGTQCHFSIESNVVVKHKVQPTIVSDVDFSGYNGEEMSINCIDEYRNTDHFYQICILDRNRDTKSSLHINESNPNISHSCEWNGGEKNPSLDCEHEIINLKLETWPNLELSLTPLNFSSNVSAMEFNCTSVPSRLLRWTVITDSGDLLDFRSLNYVSMNVAITQRPGETVLKINVEHTVNNGIQTVICSSHDTPAQESASSHRVFIDERKESGGESVSPSFTTSTMASTITSTVIYAQGTSTRYHSSRATGQQQNTEMRVPKNVENKAQNWQAIFESPYFKISSLLVMATLAIVVCILVVVVVILLRKLRLAASPNKEPSETTLHDNPVYLAFTETTDSSIDHAVPSNTCVYANI